MLVQKIVKNVRDSKFLKALTKDVKIRIEIDTESLHHSPGKGQHSEEALDAPIKYKGYCFRQDENGEFDIIAPGGALVAHTASKELAEKYADNNDIGI